MEDKTNQILELINELQLTELDRNNLIYYLKNETNFFHSPLTMKHSFSREGGLIDYILKVYSTMMTINGALLKNKYSSRTIALVSLAHPLYVLNKFILQPTNKKIYSESGKKYDELGNYDWVSILGYAFNEESDENDYGNKGFTSYMIISKFIPLNEEEIITVTYHNMWVEDKGLDIDLWKITKKFPLLSLLHSAITLVLTEDNYEQEITQ